ncbi:BREX-1 system adenine-specific DNA-methyltransferase PglX [Desulfosporosinus metallidurans]|uniref:site-specific DNA-methyltransferase (adenine-specific) n=1 Tax=Desulfosporosinus metallidurans TaxID=1888891 RepID=A0A1Q8QUA9_9FIRM|nr:BREX-1 system adenine-specific DNA-methyltransferase PglX [Desulfosporosinus metallidurans]OLN30828.1 putative type II restriction enzyme methylase subunit [Desulfosporosinus metallidurans]
MNKSVIKNFAVSARKKLIEQVMQKAFQIGITAKSITELKQEAGHIILNNIPQEKGFKHQRDKLIQEIEQKGYTQVMEEVAYTWFNRFIALRFMEVNNYLPTGVRVLSSPDPNRVEPDIIREALNVDLAVDKNVIYDFQDKNDSEGLFQYLLIHQCNELNAILPFMFEMIADYTELLFPSNLLQEGSVIRDMVTSIPEEDWKEVEIIGWLYQYYISEKKDEVFADLKKNKKITKENIPAATQLFTPKWIVQYMVENSLGRLWLESHPNEELKAQWKYYLEEAEQEPEVQQQLDVLKNPDLNPLDIKVLDPCCGSGHVLVYAFEVLYEIYKSYGYMEEDIPKLILENNLYGLDIDDRAAQLASFAVMMKARSKSRVVFRENIRLNICAIQESNWMGDEVREILVDREAWELEQEVIKYLSDTFRDAKEFGSILDVRELDLEFLEQRLDEVKNSVASDLLEVPYRDAILKKLPGIILQAKIMGTKYDVVCTNPPYMGSGGMNGKLGNFLKDNFTKTNGDMSTVFMEVCFRYCTSNGYISIINIPSWMFISTYEKLRELIVEEKLIINMLHFGRGIFGSDFGTTAFVVRNRKLDNYFGTYRRLFLVQGAVDSIEQKEKWFFEGINKYRFNQQHYLKISGSPIAYWVSENVLKSFEYESFSKIVNPRIGLVTGDTSRFSRLWYEIDINKVNFNAVDSKLSGMKWFPYQKGGPYKKWFGNHEYVINWENDGFEMKFDNSVNGRVKSHNYNGEFAFKTALTWTKITSGKFACRYSPNGFLFDDAGPICTVNELNQYFALGLLNSRIGEYYLNLINPTMNFLPGHINSIPLKKIGNKDYLVKINLLVKQNISISKTDWNSLELSWDFLNHPLLIYIGKTIEQSFNNWREFTKTQFAQLKDNEEELNRIFIDIYGLLEELTPEVQEKNVTIRKANLESDIKSFISYAVGCMLGRYSLDEEGLIFAGGKFDQERYKTFKADADGILPVLSETYFDDDIVIQFVEFVKVTFGENTLTTNLDYIAETLGRKANESSRECIRRYFLKDFYKDHVQIYKKRPIYWLFTSGKEQAFNALIYMHRYDSSMVSRVRTDYLHPLQNKLEAEFLRLNQVLVSEDSPTEKTKATKRLKVLTKQMDELKKYDEVIHNLADQQIEIDLDDGVVVNYAKFEKVLAKIN